MKSKKCLAVLTVALALTGLTGCNNQVADPNGYTYNTYLTTSPKTWNVHTWETNDESYITSFTEMGLYDAAFSDDKRNQYTIIPEMAADYPTVIDATEVSASDARKYYDGGVPDNAVYEVKLNKAAKWEDGTPITATDYIESMQRMLSPKYANFRADSYYASNFVIANAEAYYKSGRTTIESAYPYLNMDTGEFAPSSDGSYVIPDTDDWYINLTKANGLAESVLGDQASEENNNLYFLLNNLELNNDAYTLAAQRVVDFVAQYLLLGYQSKTPYDSVSGKTFYETYQSFFDNHKEDWDDAVNPEKGNGRTSYVSQEMLENMPDIDITWAFDDFGDIYVRTQANHSYDPDDSASGEVYSRELLEADLTTWVNAINTQSVKQPTWAWKMALYHEVTNTTQVDWENVGLVKVDDYTLRFYLTKSISVLNFEFALTGNWLVKTDLYDKLTTKISDESWATSYATSSKDNYMSYGPYKLSAYESGKTINLVKNDQWYGWTDGKHNGQFQMTALNTEIIQDHNTALQKFLAGDLDDIELNFEDMKKYGSSSRRTTTPESYTQKISFNSDRSKLLSRQQGANNTNKTVLSNINFRKGLSLGINRTEFAAQTTSGSTAFTGLLNDLYLVDATNGATYRATEPAKQVYKDVYAELGGNVTPDQDGYTPTPLAESSYGYNLAMAGYYAALGIQEELNSEEEGHLQRGNTINIEFRVSDDQSQTTVAMHTNLKKYFQAVVSEANKRLGLTGSDAISLELTLQKDEDYYNTAKNGNYDMIFSIWGGAAINPYGLMQVYCDPTFASCCEYGFKGHQGEYMVAIDANGNGEIDEQTENKSFADWYSYMTSNSLNEEDPDDKATMIRICAGLETGILERWEAIPIVSRASSSLTSLKIENGTDTYVNLIAYGGIRYMSFNYTNQEWADFVKNNNLEDLYIA